MSASEAAVLAAIEEFLGQHEPMAYPPETPAARTRGMTRTLGLVAHIRRIVLDSGLPLDGLFHDTADNVVARVGLIAAFPLEYIALRA